jgi:hypothetical protein
MIETAAGQVLQRGSEARPFRPRPYDPDRQDVEIKCAAPILW